jgi:transcriptional regulator with XRE-family HTH domain
MISGRQIRAARAVLGWSATQLAERAGLGLNTVLRAEAVDGVPKMRTASLLALIQALESGGVIFFGAGETPRQGGEGLRLRLTLRRPSSQKN